MPRAKTEFGALTRIGLTTGWVEMARLTGSLGRYESPERIKVIDSPQEPTSPVTPGRVIFVIAGLVGGIILGAVAVGCSATDKPNGTSGGQGGTLVTSGMVSFSPGLRTVPT